MSLHFELNPQDLCGRNSKIAYSYTIILNGIKSTYQKLIKKSSSGSGNANNIVLLLRTICIRQIAADD